MLRKTYEAPYSIISELTVRVGGKPVRVSFYPVTIYAGGTGRGSQYTTCNPSLQTALEECPLFGRRFFLIKTEELEDEEPVEVATEESIAEEKDEEPAVQSSTNFIHVPVSSPADAREYLHENYGIELRSVWKKNDLLEKAKELNIIFEGI